MWRTVIINKGDRVSLKDNWIVVSGETEVKIPLNELYSVVVDNQDTMLSVGAINALTQSSVHIVYCDKKHLPSSVVLPYNIHYRPLNVIKKQVAWEKGFCNDLWNKIVEAKIVNQARVLKMQGADRYGKAICVNGIACGREAYRGGFPQNQ